MRLNVYLKDKFQFDVYIDSFTTKITSKVDIVTEDDINLLYHVLVMNNIEVTTEDTINIKPNKYVSMVVETESDMKAIGKIINNATLDIDGMADMHVRLNFYQLNKYDSMKLSDMDGHTMAELFGI